MKRNAVKFCVASLLLTGLAGCGGGGGATTATGGGTTTASTVAVSGVAQGPIVSGTVTIQNVSAPITTSTLGTFSATIPASSVVDVTATGNYFDEVAGKTSTTNTLTLNSLASSSDSTLNVNILTTLAYQRIKSLMTGTTPLSFLAARSQAEKEVLAAFYIRDQNILPFDNLDLSTSPSVRAEDHILAAITSVFENNGADNSTALVSNWLTSFQNEIANNNGTIVTTNLIDTLTNNAIGVIPATVATNLNTEYKNSSLFTPTNISDWLDQDGDHVIGKFKYKAAQAPANTSYNFPFYTVGPSDNGATYSFALNPNNPNSINPKNNTTCAFTVYEVAVPTVATGNPVAVTCTPGPHEASSTYLQSVPTLPTVPSGMSVPIYIARYDFDPFSTVAPITPPTYAPTYATATALQTPGGALNGDVLVAGGLVAGSPVATAALFNPATNTWTATGNMNVARVGHTATFLNGKVLVVGGDKAGAAGTAELYDPSTGKWTKVASPATGHIYHTATLLSNGQVLVVGGILPNASASASYGVELYNPSSNTWLTTGAATPLVPLYNGTRYYHTATLLNDCSVLIAGGFDGNHAIADAEIFNYSGLTGATASAQCAAAVNLSALTGVWTQACSTTAATCIPGTPAAAPAPAISGSGLTIASYSHSATLLQDGTVLIAGGLGTTGTAALSRSELFDSGDIIGSSNITPTWSSAASLNTARVRHIAQLLSDGTVLVAGGSSSSTNGTLSSAELYNSGTWNLNGNMAYPRDEFVAAPITVTINTTAVNQVLLVGGGLNSVETFQ